MSDNVQDPVDSVSAGETAELARRAQIGDLTLLQDLYEKVAPALYVWTHARIHGSPWAKMDPQDILQEVWLRALQAFGTYDSSRSFRGWIIGITKNVLLQEYRKRAHDRRDAGSSSENQLALDRCPASVTSISARLARDDAVQGVLAYMADLAMDERNLVLYCGLEGYSCAQAAARLGISPEAATKRWQKLRERMRESGALRALVLEECA